MTMTNNFSAAPTSKTTEHNLRASFRFCRHILITGFLVVLTSNRVQAQQIDCIGFAQFVQSTVGDHLELPDFFQRYFKKSLKDVTSNQIKDLIAWTKACNEYLKNMGQEAVYTRTQSDANYWYQLATWISNGAQTLEQIDLLKQQENEDSALDKNLIAAQEKNLKMIAGIPNCDDAETISTLKTVVRSRFGGEEILGLRDFFDESNPFMMGLRDCKADVLLESGEKKLEYSVRWFDKSQRLLAVSLL